MPPCTHLIVIYYAAMLPRLRLVEDPSGCNQSFQAHPTSAEVVDYQIEETIHKGHFFLRCYLPDGSSLSV